MRIILNSLKKKNLYSNIYISGVLYFECFFDIMKPEKAENFFNNNNNALRIGAIIVIRRNRKYDNII